MKKKTKGSIFPKGCEPTIIIAACLLMFSCTKIDTDCIVCTQTKYQNGVVVEVDSVLVCNNKEYWEASHQGQYTDELGNKIKEVPNCGDKKPVYYND